MKLKILLLSFFCFLFLDNLYSRNKCYILLKVSDCNRCFIEINFIEKISKTLSPEIIFPKSYENNIDELKDRFPVLNEVKTTFSFNDTIYKKYEQEVSAILIVDEDGNVLYKTMIKGFTNHLNDINGLSDDEVSAKCTEFGLSGLFSENSQAFFSNNKIILLDLSFNKIFVKNLNNNESQTFSFKKSDSLNKAIERLHEKYLSNEINKLRIFKIDRDEAVNKHLGQRMNIENYYWGQDYLYLACTYSYFNPLIQGTDTILSLEKKVFIIGFDLNNLHKTKLIKIISEIHNDLYSIDPYEFFSNSNDTFYLGLNYDKTHLQENRNNKLLTICSGYLSGDSLKLNKVLPATVPEVIQKKYYLNFSDKRYSDKVIYYKIFPYYHSIYTEYSEFVLPDSLSNINLPDGNFNPMKIVGKFYIEDMIRNKKDLIIIFVHKKHNYYGIIHDNKLVTCKPINGLDVITHTDMHFIDPGRVVYFDYKNSVIKICTLRL